jgi:hypothetical protein
VFAGYGGRCACCGEDDPNVLELDHVCGGGNRHRKITGVGHLAYRWVVRNDFPQDLFQLLCGNCHNAKTRTGDCSYRRSRVRDRAVEVVRELSASG